MSKISFEKKYILGLTLFSFFEANAASIRKSPLVVEFMNEDNVSIREQKKWRAVCQKFAKKFEISKGYWKSGIASKSHCEFAPTISSNLGASSKMFSEKI